MSYHHRSPTRRALSGVSSSPPTLWRQGRKISLGSLGDDAPGDTTLSVPTVADPTGQWQAQVLAQLQDGVATLRTANTQKWLQIIATVSIPLSAAIWKAILSRRASDPTT